MNVHVHLQNAVVLTGLLAGTLATSADVLAQGPLFVSMQYESTFRHVTFNAPVLQSQPFVYVTAQSACEAEDIEVTHTNPALFQQVLELDESFPAQPPTRAFSRFYFAPTEAGLLADNPSGQHVFQTRSDTDPFCLDENSFNQPFPAGGWPSTIPTFTQGSLSALSQLDVSQPLSLQFNSFQPFAGATTASTFLYILDDASNFALDLTLPRTATSAIIPAGSLQPGTSYQIALRFFNLRDQTVNFRDHSLSFNRTTWFAFTTPGDPPPSCPADFGSEGGSQEPDGLLDNNDFIVFIQLFFSEDPLADIGAEGGSAASDGTWDNNDFIVFIQYFFEGC